MAAPTRLRQELLSLSEQERAELARDLIRSLDPETELDAERQWAEEIERRAREVLAGAAELVDGDEALARVRARLLDRRR
jgi:putative addiction module component (TIGR02574 family)